MNRSALMITIFAGFGVLGFVGCGNTENTKSERSGSSQENGDDIDLNVGDDKVEFSVLPPSDSEEGLALRTEEAPDAIPPEDREDQGQPEPEPIEPTIAPESRISIRCKNEEALPIDLKHQVSDSILPMLPSFTIGLEEHSGDGTVGYESHTFSYACGRSGALVSITKLSPKAKYKLDATYANNRGIATHKGETSFKISQGTTTLVKLYMKRIERRGGSVDVDIIFDKHKKPVGCKEIDVVCADIYAPAVCQGSARFFDGRKKAWEVEAEGSSECVARANLVALACKNGAEVPEISCKAVK